MVRWVTEERDATMVDREQMRDMSVTGNLADDPQLRQGRDGSSFVTMRVMENQRMFDREQQQWVDGDAVGYDVAVGNERLAKHSLQNLAKGDRITVRGDVQVSPYVHPESGEPGLNRRMNALDVQVSLFVDRFDLVINTTWQVERRQEREDTAQGLDSARWDGPGTAPPSGSSQQASL